MLDHFLLLPQYSGTWYEYYRKNDSYEYLGDCNTVTYTPHDNGTIGINRFSLLQEPVREQVEVEYAVFSDPEQKPLEGRWNISYQWSELGSLILLRYPSIHHLPPLLSPAR